jgi:serralysin
LDAGDGNDTLYGGVGNDTLLGGAGADELIFDGGRDIVRDFADNVDTLVLERDLWGGGNLSVTTVLNTYAFDIGSSVELRFSSTNIIRLEGLASISLLSNDISFI